MHHKDGDLLLHSIQDHLSLAPVHLAVLTRLKLQGQKGGRPCMGLAPANRVHLHAGLTSRVSLGLEQLKELVPGVTLFLGQAAILLQQLFELLLVRTQPRGLTRLSERIFRRMLALQRFCHGLSRDQEQTGDLSSRFLFQAVM